MRSQHCGYWCPGAKAPGHQYPQCWLNIHCIGPVSYKSMAHKVNSIRKWYHILKKIYLSPVLSWEWRCSWSSANRRCSNYIWVINNLIAHQGAAYIRDLMAITYSCPLSIHIIMKLITPSNQPPVSTHKSLATDWAWGCRSEPSSKTARRFSRRPWSSVIGCWHDCIVLKFDMCRPPSEFQRKRDL